MMLLRKAPSRLGRSFIKRSPLVIVFIDMANQLVYANFMPIGLVLSGDGDSRITGIRSLISPNVPARFFGITAAAGFR